jgi:hypothetical protein|tara:strand:+ start:1540 stop:1728 length:189 start_codon:yes stop_codon:yes gene_type:complete
MAISMLHIAGILIAIIAIVNITSMVMTFLGVGIESYASYLIWIIAILLFFAILPSEPTNYFI